MFKGAASITQFQDDAVEIDIQKGVSIGAVVGVSNSRGTLITQGSDSLLYSDFDYRGPANRITARIEVTRLSRVQDYVVQLWNGTELIGRNLADPLAADLHDYVFQGDFNVTAQFGLVLDLGPHRSIPSSNLVYIRSVTVKFEQV
jgi:hypothetical protein